MKIKLIKLNKNMKVGLPNFSNIDLGCEITFEVAEEEEPNWDEMWDTINQQLYIQSSGIDSSWIITKNYKNFFKTVIKTEKEVKKNE